MRVYRLTRTGRDLAKVPTKGRNQLVDYLYKNGGIGYEELVLVFGRGTIRQELRKNVRNGLILEENDGLT